MDENQSDANVDPQASGGDLDGFTAEESSKNVEIENLVTLSKEKPVSLLLLNLNPTFMNYGRLLSMFRTFGQVMRINYQTGSTHAVVSMAECEDANYAFCAFDGSDFWGHHLSIRIVPCEDVTPEQLAQYTSEIRAVRVADWSQQQQQQQQQKRKLEKEKEEEEMKKRQKASNTSASFPSDDPLKSGPFGSLLDSIDRNLLATLTTGSSTSGPDKDSTGQSSHAGYDYDLIVIGGGSGGLAAAKEAASLGARVALLDFVKPSPHGTVWSGLGGTCVNVGCIPKKLMHQAGLLGRALDDARKFGWDTPKNAEISWKKLVSVIEKELGYRHYLHEAQLQEPKVDYFNGFAEFVDVHRIKATDAIGQVKELTSKYFIIATGARPKYPVIPGIKEYCISSDDLFSLSYCPGKTLVIGASYVSLECAGFLRALGLDVTVMVRSILLRGFDQEMAKFIGAYMQNEGIKFVRPCVPTKVEMLREGRPGRYRVTATAENGMQRIDTYNTVLVAVGRDPCTSELHLENVGVTVNSSGFIICGDDESTTCPSIFAIGDVVEGRPKLTPVAIRAGKLLAKRLFGEAELKCEYENVPTTVFTPLEYGCVGLSEEEAIAKYGADSVEIYHSHFTPLEWTVPHHQENACYAKLICISSENEKVVGLHVLGPNAGEVTQGWAVGIKLGATKSDFDNAIGIHPTCAEVFTTLTVTKRSGKGFEASGC